MRRWGTVATPSHLLCVAADCTSKYNRVEKEESDLTELIQDGFALSKVADHVHVSAQIDYMTACSPFRWPVLTCRAASARQLYLHDMATALTETHLIALQLVDAVSCGNVLAMHVH